MYRYNKFNRLIIVAIIIIFIAFVIKMIISGGKVDFFYLLIGIIGIVLFVAEFMNVTHKKRTYKEVLQKGVKVTGTIVKPETVIKSDSEGKTIRYYLIIKYLDPDTNEEKEFKTDSLAINPYKKLKSNKCSVYIYNDTVIAEDFELTNNTDEAIFKDLEKNRKNK